MDRLEEKGKCDSPAEHKCKSAKKYIMRNKIIMKSQITSQFITELFAHEEFQHKLTEFISPKPRNDSQFSDTDDSFSSPSIFDPITNEIEHLLQTVFEKKFCQDLIVVQENYNYVHEGLLALRKEVDEIGGKFIKFSVSEGGGSTVDPYPKPEEFKKWENNLLQKVEVCIHRNSLKIESIFTDKLNTSEMNFEERMNESNEQIYGQCKQIVEKGLSDIEREIEELHKKIQKISNRRCHHVAASGLGETVNKEEKQQSELVKKLKNSRSFGSLLGFVNAK